MTIIMFERRRFFNIQGKEFMRNANRKFCAGVCMSG